MKRCAVFPCGVCLVAILVHARPARACSEMFLTKGGYFVSARNLDFHTPDSAMLVVSPRGMTRTSPLPPAGDVPLSWTSRYGSVAVYTWNMDVSPDGMNETGFSAALLGCDGSVYPTAQSGRALGESCCVQYFLDLHSNVADAVADALTIKLYNSVEGVLPDTMHLVLHDASGDSALLEYDGAGNMNVYRPTTPVAYNGAVTNEPFYPAHVAGLPDYEPWGGAQPIPGDDSPSSRFIRGSYCLKQMLTPSSGAEAALFAYNYIQDLASLMIIDPDFGELAWPTRWTSVRDHQGLSYSFSTWDKTGLRRVRFDDLDFTPGQSRRGQYLDDSDEGDVAADFRALKDPDGLPLLFRPLSINPARVAPQLPLGYSLYLHDDITQAFDFYVFAETPIGTYSVALDGSVRRGIVPILRKSPGAKAPIGIRVEPRGILPPEASGQPITFYAAAVEAGKLPPISSLDALDETAPSVIYMDREPMTVR